MNLSLTNKLTLMIIFKIQIITLLKMMSSVVYWLLILIQIIILNHLHCNTQDQRILYQNPVKRSNLHLFVLVRKEYLIHLIVHEMLPKSVGLKVLNILLCVTILFLLELQVLTANVIINVLLIYQMTKKKI